MATFTITAVQNYDSLTSPAGNDVFNINGGELIIDTDTRYCKNHAAATGNLGNITISATLGGKLTIDGTKVRIIPYTGGSGNVPAIGATISQGTVSAELLGVWSALNAAPTAAGSAMPASGFIKVKNKVGGNFAAGALSGITANASSVDRVGWIEVIGVEATTVTCSRLGSINMQGDWFEVGVTSGAAGQSIQMPASLANTHYAGVWIETASGSNVYEFYPSAGSLVAANSITTTARGKVCFISSQGLLRLGSDGTNTVGYVPPSGCKIRIPNIILLNCTSAAQASNAAPNATLGTRYDFTTTGGAVITIDKVNMAWYPSFAQAFQVNLSNVGILDNITISENVSPIIWDHVGVGQSAAIANLALTMSLMFAGGTMSNCVWTAASCAASGRYVVSMTDIFDMTIINDKAFSFVLRANNTTGTYTLTRLNRCSFDGIKLNGGSGQILMTTCTSVTIKNISYSDTIANNGNTGTTFPMSVVSINTNCAFITVDGIDFWGETNKHPYAALVSVLSASNNVKVRNVGTAASPLNLGSANATGLIIGNAAGAGCFNIEVKRVYCLNTRTGIFAGDNSYSEILLENVWGDYADTLTMTALNILAKGIRATNSTTGQTAVYGSHFADYFTAATTGQINIQANEKTNKVLSSNAYTIDKFSPTAGFTSTGNLMLPAIDDQITWTWPDYIIGHNTFAVIATTITCTNPNNIDLFYDIDKGAGFNNIFKNLSYKRSATGGASGTKIINLSNTAGISVGDYIFGTGIGTASRVQSIDSATQITVTVNNTATVSGVLVFNSLPAENIDPQVGFKLKVRAKTSVSSSTNNIISISIPTTVNTTSMSYQYDLDSVDAQFSLIDLQPGSEIRVYRSSDSVELSGTESSDASYTYNYKWKGVDVDVDVVILHMAYEIVRYETLQLGRNGLTIPIQQRFDRNYSNN